MAYPVHGVPTGQLAPYRTPYDMNSPGESSLLLLINLTRLTIVLGFNNPPGGISYHTPQDAHSAAFPPDINYAQGYGGVNPYPVITTHPYPPMPLTYATRPSSAGPEEKGDNAQPVLLERARGRVPGHAGLEGEHNAPGQMPAVQELRSYPGRGLASGAMSSPQYTDLVELGRRPHPTQPHAQPLGMGGRGNLAAPGTQYQSPPYNALAQSASSQHPMLSSTIGQGHNASAESSAAASLHIPQAIPGASLPQYDRLEYRIRHHRGPPRKDARGHLVDYTSLLLTHLDVVEEWKQLGLTNQDIQYLVQYYQQVSQVHGYNKVESLMDAFLQHEVRAGQIWDTMPAQNRTLWENVGVATDKYKPNFLLKRKQRRQDALVRQYGSNVVLDFYASDLKLRDRGNLPIEESDSAVPERNIPPERLLQSHQSTDPASSTAAASPAEAGNRATRKRGKAKKAAQTPTVTQTREKHTSAAPARGNLNASSLPHDKSVLQHAHLTDARNPDHSLSHHSQLSVTATQQRDRSLKASLQNIQPSEKPVDNQGTVVQKTMDTSTHASSKEPPSSSQPSEKALGKRPAMVNSLDPQLREQATELSQPTKLSEKAQGKQRAIESDNTDSQSVAHNTNGPSEKAVGKRRAVGDTSPRPRKQVPMAARQAQPDNGLLSDTEILPPPAATQASVQRQVSGVPAVFDWDDQEYEQMVQEHAPELSWRDQKAPDIPQTISAPAPAPTPATNPPSGDPDGLPVWIAGCNVSLGAQAAGISNKDYDHLPPSKRPARICTDAERQALLAKANRLAQNTGSPAYPNYPPRILSDQTVKLPLRELLPPAGALERWKREEDEDRKMWSRRDEEWRAAREAPATQQRGNVQQVEEEPEEPLRAPGDAFNPEKAP